MKERFRLEYQTKHGWFTMYNANGQRLERLTSLDEAKKERSKAIRRHRPYGRDYAYRIVWITEEVVA